MPETNQTGLQTGRQAGCQTGRESRCPQLLTHGSGSILPDIYAEFTHPHPTRLLPPIKLIIQIPCYNEENTLAIYAVGAAERSARRRCRGMANY